MATKEHELVVERSPEQASSGIFSEIFIGTLLKYGVFFSIAIVALGAILYFVKDGVGGKAAKLVSYSANTQPYFPHTLSALQTAVTHLDPLGIVTLGFLLLVFLRIFQVLLAAVNYLLQRDYRLTLVSVFVFLVLMSSLILGKAGG